METVLSAERLPSIALDVENLSSDERFAAWSATMSMCVAERLDTDGEFYARAAAWRLGDVVVIRTAIPGVRLTRSSEQAFHDGLEFYSVVLSIAGDWRCETDGAAFAVPEGAVCLLDSTTPFQIVTPGSDVIILNIGRERLDEAGTPGRFHGYRLAPSAGQLFGDYLKALCWHLSNTPATEAPLIARATRDLLVACLCTDAAPSPRDETRGDALVRVRRHIDARLGEQLSPAGIARALGLSRTRLYSIFSPVGGVQAFITRRRLIHARRALENPLDRRSIASIGYAHGFASSAHFSRMFRREFGVTPKALRARAISRTEPTGPTPGHEVGRTLRTWRRGG
jgi:AraC-like DNA-binding protein